MKIKLNEINKRVNKIKQNDHKNNINNFKK